MIAQAIKWIGIAIITIVLLIALAISFVTIGTLGVIGLIILGAGLFIIIFKRALLKVGAILAVIGFIIFLITYLGWL